MAGQASGQVLWEFEGIVEAAIFAGKRRSSTFGGSHRQHQPQSLLRDVPLVQHTTLPSTQRQLTSSLPH